MNTKTVNFIMRFRRIIRTGLLTEQTGINHDQTDFYKFCRAFTAVGIKVTFSSIHKIEIYPLFINP